MITDLFRVNMTFWIRLVKYEASKFTSCEKCFYFILKPICIFFVNFFIAAEVSIIVWGCSCRIFSSTFAVCMKRLDAYCYIVA